MPANKKHQAAIISAAFIFPPPFPALRGSHFFFPDNNPMFFPHLLDKFIRLFFIL
jgi:hypothetical protein